MQTKPYAPFFTKTRLFLTQNVARNRDTRASLQDTERDRKQSHGASRKTTEISLNRENRLTTSSTPRERPSRPRPLALQKQFFLHTIGKKCQTQSHLQHHHQLLKKTTIKPRKSSKCMDGNGSRTVDLRSNISAICLFTLNLALKIPSTNPLWKS